jgi:excinuclease ABC subunit A
MITSRNSKESARTRSRSSQSTPSTSSSARDIVVRGARVHNLKNIDVRIPRDKLVVLTGISGSGKSSLAFDTIYAEGQRRYVESLSTYARQFLGPMDKPAVDSIEGLSPAISIDQRTGTTNPRSTVGTVTEIYDYLRLLYARIGRIHCPRCGAGVQRYTVTQIIEQVSELLKSESTLLILAPLDRTGDTQAAVGEAQRAGFSEIRINGAVQRLSGAPFVVDQKATKAIEVVIGRIKAEGTALARKQEIERLVGAGLDLGNGLIIVTSATATDATKDQYFSLHYICPNCRVPLPTIEPRNFSFNSPAGACGRCLGMGVRLEVDTELVIPNKRLTLAEGAIKPWARNFSNHNQYWALLQAVAEAHQIPLDVPFEQLAPAAVKTIFEGTGAQKYEVHGEQVDFPGVLQILSDKYQQTSSDYLRQEIEQYMRSFICPACEGKRLKPESLAVTIGSRNIAEVASLTIDQAASHFKKLLHDKSGDYALNARDHKIADQALKDSVASLENLMNVGLSYLTLDRSSVSLSGGEMQRIRLATQLGLSLTGVIYILDEPSIGLHQKDNQKLIDTLKRLRDQGNSVLVVEHDSMTMEAADEIIDIGPGAGEQGGMVVAQGTPAQIKKDRHSLTGKYLSGALTIPRPKQYRKGSGKSIEIVGASEFNLKNLDVKIPLGNLVCFTGVSGSGKSTLMIDILVRALQRKFYRAKELPGAHKEIRGVEHIDKIIAIDQSPIGRTPRSNPATYTGVFTYIRDLFAETKEAKIRGYNVGKFSFNAKGGRCETCAGEGMVKIEMQFLPDVYVECEECHGRRYRADALEIHYQGYNIADILDMSVEQAMRFFRQQPIIYDKLETLYDVGLGYVRLGQSATTLSGGEAQRVKLATELSRRSTGKTLYVLDEPTTGLHFEDIQRLLDVLNKLVDKGNTVLIIEHNLDVIKCADWIIDMGPDGGSAGGEIVAQGTPPEIVKVSRSWTGKYLKEVL